MRYSRISLPFGLTALVRASLAPGAAPGKHERLLRRAIAAQIPTDRLTFHAQGRYALFSLLRALNRKSGTVLMPGFGCAIVPITVEKAGFQPVLLDVSPNRPTLSPDALRYALQTASAPPAAVIVPHELGQPSDPVLFDIVAAHNTTLSGPGIAVIEDLAIAMGGAYPGDAPLGAKADAYILSGGVGKPWSAWSFGAAGTAPTARARTLFAQLPEPHDPLPTWPALIRLAALCALSLRPLWPLRNALLRRGTSDADTTFDESMASRAPSRLDIALLAQQVAWLHPNLAARRIMAQALSDCLTKHGMELAFDPAAASVPSRVAFLTPGPVHRQSAISALAAAGLDATQPGRTALSALENIEIGPGGLANAEALAERVLSPTLPRNPALIDDMVRRTDQALSKVAD